MFRIRPHRILAALAVICALSAAHAQSPTGIQNVEVALEADAGSVVLPTSPDGALVVAPCGSCNPKSFRATPSTLYFLGDRQVTLAELAAAVAGRPETLMTVSYSVKTGELTRLTASIDPPPAAKRP